MPHDAMWSIPTQNLFEKTGNIPAEEHRTLIQRRVDELKNEICALNSLHNSLSPINRLPPEVLSDIIIQGSSQSRKESLLWIRLSHICKHWREVALDCASLWSDISFQNPTLTSVMLSRTKSAPLTVHIDTSFPQTTPRINYALSEVFSSGDRLQSLTVDDRGKKRRLQLRKALSQCTTAPILEDLRIITREDNCLNSGFLKDGAPSLVHLELSGCIISDWNAQVPLGAGLQILDLSTGLNRTTFRPRPSGKDFLSSLRKLPLLHTLRLSLFLPNDRYTGHPALLAPIVCRSLRTLDLHDSSLMISNFLRVVHVPDVQNMKIHTPHHFRTGRPDFTELLTALHMSWKSLVDAGVRELRLVREPLTAFHDVWLEFNGPVGRHHSSETAHTLDLTGLNVQVEADTIIHGVSQYWTLEPLQILDIDSILVAEAWATTLRDLPNLRHITIVGVSMLNFCNAFDKEQEGAALTQAVPFPALEVIALEETMLPPELFQKLPKALFYRSFSPPAFKVVISHCTGITEDSYQLMGNILPHVEVVWEGRG
ncbi:hypothetical protein DFP72DRAFT_963897 [Ephemerocybe angulata]|uniref:F-box domain-containing protein n=1 Tax=Ephemerocybe angulata TaxID=980116 RepID=A0A8H6I0M6_9AGAR|nr:hypothetical protein DFP72DRAFT_963897 [Tulosesus angulatus]